MSCRLNVQPLPIVLRSFLPSLGVMRGAGLYPLQPQPPGIASCSCPWPRPSLIDVAELTRARTEAYHQPWISSDAIWLGITIRASRPFDQQSQAVVSGDAVSLGRSCLSCQCSFEIHIHNRPLGGVPPWAVFRPAVFFPASRFFARRVFSDWIILLAVMNTPPHPQPTDQPNFQYEIGEGKGARTVSLIAG